MIADATQWELSTKRRLTKFFLVPYERRPVSLELNTTSMKVKMLCLHGFPVSSRVRVGLVKFGAIMSRYISDVILLRGNCSQNKTTLVNNGL